MRFSFSHNNCHPEAFNCHPEAFNGESVQIIVDVQDLKSSERIK